MSRKDLNSSGGIRSYMAEMHNDALFYLEKSKNASDDFQKNRFLRSAIINFATSVEAAFSKLVHDYLKQNKNNIQKDDYQKLLTALEDPNSIPPWFFRTIDGKIKVFEEIFGSTFDEELKQRYKDFTILRNEIIHYSSSYQNKIYEDGTLERAAEAAPELLKEFLGVMFTKLNLPSGFEKNTTSRY